MSTNQTPTATSAKSATPTPTRDETVGRVDPMWTEQGRPVGLPSAAEVRAALRVLPTEVTHEFGISMLMANATQPDDNSDSARILNPDFATNDEIGRTVKRLSTPSAMAPGKPMRRIVDAVAELNQVAIDEANAPPSAPTKSSRGRDPRRVLSGVARRLFPSPASGEHVLTSGGPFSDDELRTRDEDGVPPIRAHMREYWAKRDDADTTSLVAAKRITSDAGLPRRANAAYYGRMDDIPPPPPTGLKRSCAVSFLATEPPPTPEGGASHSTTYKTLMIDFLDVCVSLKSTDRWYVDVGVSLKYMDV